MRQREPIRFKIWELGVERNADQKRALGKSWLWTAIALVSFLFWLFIMLQSWNCGRIGAAIINGIGMPAGIFFLIFFTYVINDYYEQSITATEEQEKEYLRKHSKIAPLHPDINKDEGDNNAND